MINLMHIFISEYIGRCQNILSTTSYIASITSEYIRVGKSYMLLGLRTTNSNCIHKLYIFVHTMIIMSTPHLKAMENYL